MRQSREKPVLGGEQRGGNNVVETSGTQIAREDWSETQGLCGLSQPENQAWTENKLRPGFPLFYWYESGKSPTEFKLEQSQLQSQIDSNLKKGIRVITVSLCWWFDQWCARRTLQPILEILELGFQLENREIRKIMINITQSKRGWGGSSGQLSMPLLSVSNSTDMTDHEA